MSHLILKIQSIDSLILKFNPARMTGLQNVTEKD